MSTQLCFKELILIWGETFTRLTVDQEDYDHLTSVKWQYSKKCKHYFTMAGKVSISIGKFILDVNPKIGSIHFKNGNRFDYRKENLEIV